MIGVIAVILVFGALIFFHELGHFLVARSMGVGVKVFSLGFGPVLFSRTRGKTRYQLSAFPLGGYVSLVGETPDAEIPEPFTRGESFALRPPWQRFLIILAGAMFNLFLAWFICWGLAWSNGVLEAQPVVGSVKEGTPAASSPLRPGDRILSVNGKSIENWVELPAFMQENKGKDVTFVVERSGGEQVSFVITPELLTHTLPDGGTLQTWGIGIVSGEPVKKQYSFLDAAIPGLKTAWRMVTLIKDALADLIAGRVAADNLGGPILIAQSIYKQTDYGLVSVLMLTAFISVNLGMLNLLPIPVLDGGHLFFLLVEMGARKPVPVFVQEKAMMVGLALLLSLFLFATYNDVMRIVSG